MSATERLLRGARLRIKLAALGRGVHRAVVAVGALVLIGLIVARLLGLLPGTWFTPLTLGLAALAAVLIGVAFVRSPSPTDVARTVDSRAHAKELFLTTALIQGSAGEYSPLVVEQAEERAAKLKAGQLLPFSWAKGVRDVAVCLIAVAAAYLWLPQLDPFRMDAKRQETVRQEQRLAEMRKITAMRKEELKEKAPAVHEQVEKALAKLDQALKDVKPEMKEANAKKLNEEAQDFSQLWKKVSEQLPKNASEQMEKAAQSFGDTKTQQELKEMLSQLKKGDPKALQDALEKMRQELQALAKQPAGPEQKKEVERKARELAKMADQLRQQLGEKGLNDALQRALEQMDLAKLKELAKEGLDGAEESLQLSKEELQRIAESFKDLNNIEDALKNLQAAKQLNEKGKLDGKDAEGAGAKTLEDYKQLYEKLLAQQGQQPGNGGQSGPRPGIADRGNVGEDKDAQTKLKDEKTKNQIGAGKLLMQWKDDGVGETGQRTEDYQAAVRAVKESVAEAIRNEQVPPGYHPAIQKYFDRIPSEAPRK